jgi:cyd operon protein YbgT
MWYFTWILGIGLALAFGIVNVMWLEASYVFGHLDEDDIYNRFGGADAAPKQDSGGPERTVR